MNPVLHSAALAASILRCEGLRVDERLVLQAALNYAVETSDDQRPEVAVRDGGLGPLLGKNRGGAGGKN